MPKYDKQFADLVERVYQSPEGKAYLRMIKASEGGEYDITFGNHKITDFSKHPGRKIKFNDRAGGGVSTAAGAYQITNPTWNGMAPRIGINDFSAESQDRVALALALEKPGMYEAIMSRNVPKMVYGSNDIYTSLPGSKEGGKRHALTTMEYAQAAYDDKLKDFKGARWSDKGKNFEYTTGTTGTAGSSQDIGYSLHNDAMTNLMSNLSGSGSLVERTLQDIQNKSYADPGRIPFKTYSGNHSAFMSLADTTTEEGRQELVRRLFNRDPNVQYGLSFVGSSLRPTKSVTDVNGNITDMIELPNGNFINAQTGERLNADGTAWTEPVVDSQQEEVVLVDDLNDPHPNLTTAEAALPPSNTPLPGADNVASSVANFTEDSPTLTVANTGSPTDYASLNAQIVNARGGDVLTRGINMANDLNTNLRGLIKETIVPSSSSRLA